jgi:hypothetical protein
MKVRTRTTTARALAVTGTTLTGLPLAAPLVLAVVTLATAGVLRVDFLMPGELFALVITGAGLQLAAAFLADQLATLIGTFAATTVVMFGATTWIADATGLSSGAIAPAGWPLALLLTAYGLYVGAVIGLVAAGIALCRVTFAHSSPVRHA